MLNKVSSKGDDIMLTFNNFLFKTHFFSLFLITFITFLNQDLIAQQGGISVIGTDTTVSVGNLKIHRGALNSYFYLAAPSFGYVDPFEYLTDPYAATERAVAIYYQLAQPFLDAGLTGAGLHRYRLTPLIYAVVHEDIDAIHYLVEEAGVRVDMQDSVGETAFTWAQLIGNDDILAYFGLPTMTK